MGKPGEQDPMRKKNAKLQSAELPSFGKPRPVGKPYMFDKLGDNEKDNLFQTTHKQNLDLKVKLNLVEQQLKLLNKKLLEYE